MSAITLSPSPRISPGTSFHIQKSSNTAPATTQTSPGSPWLSASVLSTLARFSAPTKFRRVTSIGGENGVRFLRESNVEIRCLDGASQYVDAGTQYSPDGYPPTADRSFVLAKRLEERGSFATSSTDKKRKEFHSPQHKNTAATANAPSPSPELQPRRVPPAAKSIVTTDCHTESALDSDQAKSIPSHPSAPKRSKPKPESTKAMPVLYQDCNARDLGTLISIMLIELIQLNDRIPLRDSRLTHFHSRAPPGISVSDYLQRLIRHATLRPAILLSMVWYIDRLCELYPIFTISSLTVHRFLITAATVACKGLSDVFWTNPIYAKVGGIPVTELATLELEFLEKLQWKIMPKSEVLEDYYRGLVERTEGFEFEGGLGASSEGTSLDAIGESGSDRAKEEDEDMIEESISN